MVASLLLLEEPAPLSRRSRLVLGALGASYLALVVVLTARSDQPLEPVPALPVAHAWSMAVVAVTTSLVVFGHAGRCGRRGYLVLGATFSSAGIALAALPLMFPGGLRLPLPDGTPQSVLGGIQSSITLYYFWHVVLVVGVPLAAVVLGRDVRTGRPPGLRHGLLPGVLAGTLPALGAVAVVAFAPDVLPGFIGGSLTTATADTADTVLAVLAVCGVLVTARTTGAHSPMGRWLLVIATFGLGQSIVNLNTERYSLGWYYERAFGFAAMFALLIWLVLKLGQVEGSARILATRDPLTDVATRSALLSHLDRELLRARANGSLLCLLFLDLDDFKDVNDALGHKAGDEVLREVARRIGREVRGSDMVGRLGGDEFAVVLTDLLDHATAFEVGRRISLALGGSGSHGSAAAALGASMGLAFYPADGEDVETLLSRSDSAMYAAKRAGRGEVRAWSAEGGAGIDEAMAVH